MKLNIIKIIFLTAGFYDVQGGGIWDQEETQTQFQNENHPERHSKCKEAHFNSSFIYSVKLHT